MKAVTRSIKFFFILLALVLIALLAFIVTFDANNYKPQIIEQVEQATGRDFAIDGDINLSVFPWIGLKVEQVTLGNEKGFSAKHFAAIEQLDIKVNVLPLIKKEVEINTIRLHGLDVTLEVAKNKTNNWSGLSQSTGDTKEKADVQQKAAKENTEDSASEKQVTDEPASALKSLKVEGFEFVDAVIRYIDNSTGMRATVSELNLTTSEIEFDEQVEVNFGARIENNQPEIDTRLKMSTLLTLNKELTVFKLQQLVFTVLAEANEFIVQDETIELKADIDVSMEEQIVRIKQLMLSALGTTTDAEMTVSQFLETPLIQGGFAVQPFNARAVAKRAGVELPVMARADALHGVALKTNFKMQGNKVEANDFNLNLDDSTLTGWLHVIDISQQKLRYDLAFDRLNLNDYLPPVVADAESSPQPVASDGAEAADTADTGDEKIALPTEMMRKMDIKGDFRIASLLAKNYDIKQFLMSLNAAKGVIAIKPLSMQVLAGQIASNVVMNVEKDIPAYAIDLDVKQIQVGPVANPVLKGMMGEKPLEMDGAVNVTMAVNTTGDTVNTLKKASTGQIVLDMNETRVEGFDPEFYMRSSIAKYLDESGFGLSKTVMGNYRPREVTVFDTIHSTVNLADGKARTDDFLMSSKRVQVGAKGYVDIMANTLDVTSSVKLPRGKTAVEKVLDEPMYVRIHGPFAALQYELDKDRMKKSTSDVLKNEAKAKLEAEKQRLKAKADAEKQRLKEKADAERRRAEEKAKQKLQDNTKKYEDKLKDKLKGLF